jgi:hypothetical protein
MRTNPVTATRFVWPSETVWNSQIWRIWLSLPGIATSPREGLSMWHIYLELSPQSFSAPSPRMGEKEVETLSPLWATSSQGHTLFVTPPLVCAPNVCFETGTRGRIGIFRFVQHVGDTLLAWSIDAHTAIAQSRGGDQHFLPAGAARCTRRSLRPI